MATVAGGITSIVVSTALGADPVAISTWFFGAIDGLLSRIQAGYALNRRSAMGFLPRHGALSNIGVSPVPGSLDVGALRRRLEITGPIAFKTAIAGGKDTEQALRSMATQMGGVADEYTRNGDRDVITQTIRHGRGLIAYRRRLAGKSCGFCSMLASRGAVYGAESGNFRTHPHCRCWLEPVYKRRPEPPEVQRLQRQWQRVTAGETGQGKARAWRRHWEDRATPTARAREGIAAAAPGRAGGVPGPTTQMPIRSELMRAHSTPQVSRAFEAEAKRITGRDIPADFDGSVATAREHAEGLLVGLERFPEADLHRVSTGRTIGAAYAEHENGIITFDREWSSVLKRDEYLDRLGRDVQSRFHPAGMDNPAGLALHEFGHAIDIETIGEIARPEIAAIVRRNATSNGVTARETIEFNVSRYATRNPRELAAEAFADVMLNGQTASVLSRDIYAVLERHYAAGGRVLRSGRGIVSPAGPDLSGMTVPQLRTLARERGVTIPVGAKKADIVRLLDETPQPSAISVGVRTGQAALDSAVHVGDIDALLLRAGVPEGDRLAAQLQLSKYSQSNFANANRSLYGETLGDTGRRQAREMIAGLDPVFAHARLADDILVYRGDKGGLAYRFREGQDFKLPPGVSRLDVDKPGVDMTGAEWRSPAYESTSASRKVAEDFSQSLRADAGQPTVLTIRAPKDTPAVTFSRTLDRHEAEITLGRGQRFRVVADRGVVDGIRRLDVEVIPTPPKKATAVARQRQSAIDTRRATGDLLADTLERLAAEVDTPVLVRSIEQAARRLGVSKRTTDTLLTAARTGDRAQIEAAVARLARTGKVRVDPVPELVGFDRATMQGLGDVRAGAKVRVIRPGVVTDVDGQTVRLSKSVVEELTPAEIRQIERRVQREATRIRFEQVQQATGTSRLLAEIDELLANKATARTIRERLDDRFLAPEQLFANADPAVLRALREVADEPVKLRAAVTRLGTRAKIKPVSKAGAKVKFDPDLMESVGSEIRAGAQVTVVRRGASVTLPDGTVVQLSKAQVTPVVKPVKVTGRPAAKVTPIHDLIDAPDAEIERALRDVYEGKFGPFTTKVEISITRAGTRTSKSGRVTQVDPSVHIEGKIYDSTGHQIGDFGRSIGPVTLHYADGVVRREVWADHSIVQLDPKFQGKGFGTEFNRRAIAWYRESGVHGISLNDHNGYVWASQGFDWGARGMAAITVEDMRDLIAAIRAGATKDKYGVAIPKALREAKDLDAQLAAADDVLERVTRLNPGDPGYPTAREVSQIGRTTQKGKTSTWFGKYFMFNNGSTNELILNPAEGIVLS